MSETLSGLSISGIPGPLCQNIAGPKAKRWWRDGWLSCKWRVVRTLSSVTQLMPFLRPWSVDHNIPGTRADVQIQFDITAMAIFLWAHCRRCALVYLRSVHSICIVSQALRAVKGSLGCSYGMSWTEFLYNWISIVSGEVTDIQVRAFWHPMIKTSPHSPPRDSTLPNEIHMCLNLT